MSNFQEKQDYQKEMFTLLDPECLKDMARVLTDGEIKYPNQVWKKTSKDRLLNAALRHINSYQLGILKDSESGKSHLIHAMIDLMFINYKDNHDE